MKLLKWFAPRDRHDHMEDEINVQRGKLAEAVVIFERRRYGVQQLAEEALRAMSEAHRA